MRKKYDLEAFVEELTQLSRVYGLYLEVTADEALVIVEAHEKDNLSKMHYVYDKSYGAWGDLCWEYVADADNKNS